MVNVASSAFES